MSKLKLNEIHNNQFHKKFNSYGFEGEYEIKFLSAYGTPVIMIIDLREDKGFQIGLHELVDLTNEAKKFFRNPTKGEKDPDSYIPWVPLDEQDQD